MCCFTKRNRNRIRERERERERERDGVVERREGYNKYVSISMRDSNERRKIV